MSEAQIEERINTLENKKLEYESWINSKDAESTTYEYRQRVRQDIEKFEKEINDLYQKLRDLKALNTGGNTQDNNISYSSNLTREPVIQARLDAQKRFFGMSKMKQTMMTLTGQKKKFQKLWDRAGDKLTQEEKEQVEQELGRMFR